MYQSITKMAALSEYIFVSALFGIIKRKYYFQERTDKFRINVYLSFRGETPDLVWKFVVWEKTSMVSCDTLVSSANITYYNMPSVLYEKHTWKLCGYHLYSLIYCEWVVSLHGKETGFATDSPCIFHPNVYLLAHWAYWYIVPELYGWGTMPLMKYIQVLDVKYSDAIWQGCSASAICHS